MLSGFFECDMHLACLVGVVTEGRHPVTLTVTAYTCALVATNSRDVSIGTNGKERERERERYILQTHTHKTSCIYTIATLCIQLTCSLEQLLVSAGSHKNSRHCQIRSQGRILNNTYYLYYFTLTNCPYRRMLNTQSLHYRYTEDCQQPNLYIYTITNHSSLNCFN